jgi:hypothetical protein
MLALALSLCLSAASASPDKDAFDPPASYVDQEIEGWKVHVHRRLLEGSDEERALGEQVRALLRVKLFDVAHVVREPMLADLQAVPIWLELDNTKYNPCCCYHPDVSWLKANGFLPDKAKGVEISHAKRFIEWSYDQPSMILHELAHAYHDRVFGYDDARIAAAHKRAVEEKKYERVLRISGKEDRHYALNNPMEFFAEATEAYLGTNDFYPFVRAELKEHDPETYRLMELIWGAGRKK